MHTVPTITRERALPLKDRAYARIKKQILREELEPNSFLSERGLARDLGMSNTPVRLALARLEHEGYVRISPQQGIVVVALTVEEIVDYIDFRLALESFVVRQITGALSAREVEALEDNLRRQREVLDGATPERKDREALLRMDVSFHLLLSSAFGNRQISRAVELQHDMLFRVANRVFRTHPERLEQSVKEHHEIVEAIVGGVREDAVSCIEAHILKIKPLLVGVR